MAGAKCVNSENKSCKSTSRVWRILWLIPGLLLLLCLCEFKTFLQRTDDQHLPQKNRHLNRQLLQDKADNKRVSLSLY
jgi:hypothetical protein